MSKNECTIFLKFASLEKLYECTVPLSSSFHQILLAMKPMIVTDLKGFLSLDQDLCVFRCYDNWECDPDVSLRSQQIQDGMEFFVI